VKVNSVDTALDGTAGTLQFVATVTQSPAPAATSSAETVTINFDTPVCSLTTLNAQAIADMTTSVGRGTPET